jgi:hypothetical protein
MNRDEQRNRPAGLPPVVRAPSPGHLSLYPSEPGGASSWCGVNLYALTFAIVNWYEMTTDKKPDPMRTRGEIIPQLLKHNSLIDADSALRRLPLNEYQPFRLIGLEIQPVAKACEWRWDGHHLGVILHLWQPLHWFSSGFDEAGVNAVRAVTSSHFLPDPWPSTADMAVTALRALHCSHLPMPGPYSICMHRGDAETVSYTELVVSPTMAVMRYAPQAPCKHKLAELPPFTLALTQINYETPS